VKYVLDVVNKWLFFTLELLGDQCDDGGLLVLESIWNRRVYTLTRLSNFFEDALE